MKLQWSIRLKTRIARGSHISENVHAVNERVSDSRPTSKLSPAISSKSVTCTISARCLKEGSFVDKWHTVLALSQFPTCSSVLIFIHDLLYDPCWSREPLTCVFLRHQLLGLLPSKEGHGIFNVRYQLLGLLLSKEGHGMFNVRHQLLGLLLSKEGHGMFNVRHQLLGLLLSKEGRGMFNVRHQLLGLLLSKEGHGIFNVRNDLGVCCTHEGTGEAAGVLALRRDERSLTLSCPGVEPLVTGLRSNALAMPAAIQSCQCRHLFCKHCPVTFPSSTEETSK